MKKYRKPPLGVKPRFIWEEERIQDLQDAMKRHIENGFMIPVEWVKEHNELLTKRNETLEKIMPQQKGAAPDTCEKQTALDECECEDCQDTP